MKYINDTIVKGTIKANVRVKPLDVFENVYDREMGDGDGWLRKVEINGEEHFFKYTKNGKIPITENYYNYILALGKVIRYIKDINDEFYFQEKQH